MLRSGVNLGPVFIPTDEEKEAVLKDVRPSSCFRSVSQCRI